MTRTTIPSSFNVETEATSLLFLQPTTRVHQEGNNGVDIDINRLQQRQPPKTTTLYGLVNDDGVSSSQTSLHKRIITIDDAIEFLGNGPFQTRILWAAGLCFAADSMEILLLSFLTIVLKVQWDLTEQETDSITSSVFIGALVGTLILGTLGDHYGRKPIFICTAMIICVFGIASAFSHCFVMLLLCRFMVGFGVGGVTVPFDTLAEFVPSTGRGTDLLVIEYFWTAGTLLVPLLAWWSLHDENNGDNDSDVPGWRYFVLLCSIPCFIATVLGLLYVPESPRWLLAQGRHEEALAILRKAATRNGKCATSLFPNGIQVIDEEEEGDTNICDLLAPAWRKVTLTLWATWAGQAFLYYGTVIVVTLVFSTTSEEDSNQKLDGNDDVEDNYSFDYQAIFTSASAEIAGTTLILCLVDRVGRIPSQALSYLLGGLSVFVLSVLAARDHPPRLLMMMAAFLARMLFMCSTCATWVSTAEIATTEIRTTMHSAANAVGRIGAALSPFVLSQTTSFRTIGYVTLGLGIFTSFCSWNLPETKGVHMGAVRHQQPQPMQHTVTIENGAPQQKSTSNSNGFDV